jgi:hypothetical protein
MPSIALLFLLPLSQSDARASTILVDELNAYRSLYLRFTWMLTLPIHLTGRGDTVTRTTGKERTCC